MATDNSKTNYRPCSIKLLPRENWVSAAATATEINPNNAPAANQFRQAFPGMILQREHLAVLTTKRWQSTGVLLTVGFLDNPPPDLRIRILSHMNSWSAYCNVKFTETATDPEVRITRLINDGYWSYLGTDILHIDLNKPTMNLDGFTMDTLDSEFFRVIRHETGHTLGFPHEHMREEIVNRIDREKAIKYFERTQGWSEQEVIDQVLTAIDSSALMATEHADVNSIMCYGLPAEIMTNGVAVPGGMDIDELDKKFAASVYPKAVQFLS